MKTYKKLYAQIIDFDNLHQAWRKARRGKRYKSAAATFERHLDEEITLLAHELTDGPWHPGGFRSFTVHEPKRRKISAAPFRDRVVNHALVNRLKLVGRTLQAALDAITETAEEIVAEMQHSIDTLEDETGQIPERQHSIRAVMDYSWQIINSQ